MLAALAKVKDDVLSLSRRSFSAWRYGILYRLSGYLTGAAHSIYEMGMPPSPAAEANADGSTAIFFGPSQPARVSRRHWIQAMPGKGWFLILAPL